MTFRGVMIGSENPEALGAFSTGVLGTPGIQEGSWFGWTTAHNCSLAVTAG